MSYLCALNFAASEIMMKPFFFYLKFIDEKMIK